MQVVEKFVAYDDENRAYPVIVRQAGLDTSDQDGRGSISGLKEFRLADGRALNQISEAEFKIVATGSVIKRR